MPKQFTKTEMKKIKQSFLKSFAKTGDKKASAKIAGVSQRMLYYWLDDDSDFCKKANKVGAKFLIAKAKSLLAR